MPARVKPPAGYSGTPLAAKLGIKAGSKVAVKGAPRNYRELLAPVPAGVTFGARASSATDVVHIFSAARGELASELPRLLASLRPDAAIWVSWPKKASKVPTDVTEDTIRGVALPLGLVDVKVCAADETWSGLKLVVRKENRR
ncbi:MAG TPA: hypothetical protein VLT89_03095 [Usitatibacter sp.]|nr:hypothetical protein [Usitatibacter sp.]